MAKTPPPPVTPPPLAVLQLPVGDLEPNPWNPNVMDEVTRAKLLAYLRVRGLLQPLVVRPHPEQPGRYQLLGGYHRWLLCKEELGYTEVPCVVVELSDREAKVLTVNLNELSGEPAPHLLAQLIHDLSRDLTLDDMATQLPYDSRELADALALLQVPDGLALQLEKEAATHRAGAVAMLSFAVDNADVVEEAIGRLADTLDGKNRRGRALVALCQAWLAANPLPVVVVADGEADGEATGEAPAEEGLPEA